MSEVGAATPMQASGVQDFASSELFERTFQEGMQLVEETAAYLDGAGRQDSKLLSRDAALAYAGESMRLTTRLMQVASWLLVQRAVREGEMPAAEAFKERYRIAEPWADPEPEQAGADLPGELLSLMERSVLLYGRVLRLDRRMYVDTGADEAHPVLAQHERLAELFGQIDPG